jgi:hypothetical protein
VRPSIEVLKVEMNQRFPFAFSRETERAAIDRGIRDATKRQMAYEMVDAVLRVRESGAVTLADLAPIRAGLEASDEAVWGRAVGWLAKLHAFAPKLSEMLDEVVKDGSAAVRFHLCASLDRFPDDVAVPLLRQFLRDRSAKVRGTVMTVATKAHYRELLPDFETLLKQERDGEMRKNLQQALALLNGKSFTRDGMLIRRLKNGDIEYEMPG